MKDWAAQLSTDLLHTPKQDRVHLIRTATWRAIGRAFCSYCGELSDYSGLSDAERSERLLAHILKCPKRPELKFLNICIAAAEAIERWEAMDDEPEAAEFGKSMAILKTRLDAALLL
jgi:hypothetical protein